MIIIQQTFLGLLFLMTSFLSFTLPSIYFLKKFNFDLNDDLDKFVVFSVFGLSVFTLTAYILAALHLRFFMYLFPLFGMWSILKYKKSFFERKFKITQKKFFLSVLIIGIISQVAVNAPSGLLYKDGIYFWSSHGHDGVWHLSLMEQMQKEFFPFQNPELAGAKLQNYHFFVDLLMSEFSRLFYFSNLDIYFRFMPIVFSLLLGLSAFILVRAWSKSELAGIWSMIFVYFAGSFGYLIYIPTHKSLGGESIFWVSQTQSVLGNPPHAAAFIITTAFLFAFLKFLRSRKINFFFLSSFLGGVAIGFKVYAGVLILGGLLIIGIFELLAKRSYKTFLLFLTTLLIALAIYLPNSKNSQDFLIWHPWWFIRTMVVASDRLNWLDLELRRQTYLAEGNFKRVVQVELTAFLIFLFGNLGMRFLGFLTIFKQLKEDILDNLFNLFFLLITMASFFIPVLFLQKGVAWNAIQFNQYFLLFFGFLAAITTAWILSINRSKLWSVVISTIIIFLSIPTQLGLLWQFYSNPPLSKISNEELEGLNFLRQQKGNIVLVLPFNKYERDKYKDPPIPIYAWYDTGYVTAFSGKQTLISDEEQVNIMGYDVTRLIEEREEAFQSRDYHKMNNFLQKYKIDYVYLGWDQKTATDSAFLNMEPIFINKDARVFKVKK
ncbi:hypothetical protein HYW41_01715 [Candidatus Daviesbacteria bacterium]|nr:hypothetical protein [Candidatus Daviesbacteria bacterium]